MRYDAAIIGAGANGLTAAATLARAGLNTIVLDRANRPGGRLVTEQFHPGFSASLYAERVQEIPGEVTESLGLNVPLHVENLPDDLKARRDGALARIFDEARQPQSSGFREWLRRGRAAVAPEPSPAAWPGADLAARRLADWPHLRAWALLGRATDPHLAGSALTLLGLAGAESLRGGLGALGAGFARAAAGAQFSLGAQASEVMIRRGRFGSHAAGVSLADGSTIEADAVISTLDLRSSLLSLFAWGALPPAMTASACHFRMGGGTARLLLALKRPSAATAPLLLPGDDAARSAFRRGAAPKSPALLIDPVSSRDATLAPPGCATLAVTVSSIPARLFDGAWTQERRLRLSAAVLARVEAVLPGTLGALSGLRIIVPPDIEEQLAVTDGDLDGGLYAPDQMLGLRPGARTALNGFYLGGPSCAAGPLGTGAAGFAAATSLLADVTARRWL